MKIFLCGILLIIAVAAPTVAGQESIVHRTSATSVSGFRSAIDHPQLNGNADAIVHVEAPAGYQHPIAVWYIANKWHIFNADQASMSPGTAFGIRFWTRPDPLRFAHVVTTRNVRDGRTVLESAQLNGNSTASVSVTQSMSNARGGYWNANEPKAEYDARDQRWYIVNANGQPILAGNAYNIIIADGAPFITQTITPATAGPGMRPPATGTVISSGPIGYATTPEPLRFAATLGRKIILYPGQTGDVGLSVQGNLFQIHSDKPDADVAIGYDQAGAFTERLRVKGNGAIAVNGNAGQAGQVLLSKGPNESPVWTGMPVPVVAFSDHTLLTGFGPTGPAEARTIPALKLSLAVQRRSTVLVTAYFRLLNVKPCPALAACSPSFASFQVYADGNQVSRPVGTSIDAGTRGGHFQITNLGFELSPGSHVIEFYVGVNEADMVVTGSYSSAIAYPIL